ncbi:hypothetical protein MRX96_019505 [Rhipicephalus microplus]
MGDSLGVRIPLAPTRADLSGLSKQKAATRAVFFSLPLSMPYWAHTAARLEAGHPAMPALAKAEAPAGVSTIAAKSIGLDGTIPACAADNFVRGYMTEVLARPLSPSACSSRRRMNGS